MKKLITLIFVQLLIGFGTLYAQTSHRCVVDMEVEGTLINLDYGNLTLVSSGQGSALIFFTTSSTPDSSKFDINFTVPTGYELVEFCVWFSTIEAEFPGDTKTDEYPCFFIRIICVPIED